MYRNLQDADLPVRLAAATALHRLLHNELALGFMKPALGSVLQIFLRLMGEIDSEELVEALEELVAHFKDDVAPFALQLAEHLVTSYQRLIGTSVEEDDGEGALAAVGCAETVKRVLEACKDKPTLLAQLEGVVYPLLAHALTAAGLDAVQDGFDSVALLVYHGQGVSDQLWKLYPQLLFAVCGEDGGGFAQEFLAQASVCIQNFIAKDPAQFLGPLPGGTEPIAALTCKFLERCLQINGNSQAKQDGLVVMKLFIAMLENLQGRIDDYLPFIMQACMRELQ